MEAEVREALRHLTTAFEIHFEAVAARRSPDDAAVDDAYEVLAEAFERYEDALDSEYAEALPLELVDEAEGDLDDEDDDDDVFDDEDAPGAVEADERDLDELDAHAEEDEDEMDDDLDEFNLRDDA